VVVETLPYNRQSPHKHPQFGTIEPLWRAAVVTRVPAGTPVAEIARGMGIARQTVYKWLGRANAAHGEPVPGDPGAALEDRSSRPNASPHRLSRVRRRQILKRRRQRSIGREYVNVAIDDHSRLANAEVLPDEIGPTTTGFLRRAVAGYATQGIVVQRLLTNNDGAYRSAPVAIAAVDPGSASASPSPIAPRPMTRRNVSSAPCSPNGPMPSPAAAPPG
jgi:transposase-like protein